MEALRRARPPGSRTRLLLAGFLLPRQTPGVTLDAAYCFGDHTLSARASQAQGNGKPMEPVASDCDRARSGLSGPSSGKLDANGFEKLFTNEAGNPQGGPRVIVQYIVFACQ